jgi:glucose/arabinose dehydrogenase
MKVLPRKRTRSILCRERAAVRRSRSTAIPFAAILAFVTASHAATPPLGFLESVIVDGESMTRPNAIAYEPGSGNLFILEQGDNLSVGTARVLRWNSSTNETTVALTLQCVDGTGERGLLGIAFDPDYLVGGGANRFVYLFYTRAFGGACTTGSGVRNRVSRFSESSGTLLGESILLEGPNLGATNHNGGTLRFGTDETLFISMGDNNTDDSPNPASRNLNDLRGKILRIRRDGMIPTDNPFFGQAGRREEIWAWGLRNPFRISVDSDNGDLYIADVGENTWEEIDLGEPGGDYGYPCLEGPAPFRSCVPAFPIAPIYAYGHDNQTPPVSGATVIGGPVYRDTAFPADYHGQYFFGDFIAGWIRRADIGPNHMLTNVATFLPDAGGVVDMAVSPSGCLTWVGYFGTGVREVCEVFTASDIDDSLRVDGLDLARLARAFGSSAGDPAYDLAADINVDDDVDGEDLSILASVFGLTLP